MKSTMKWLAIPAAGVLVLGLPLLGFAQAPPLPPAPFTTIDEVIGGDGIICQIFRYIFAFLILIAVVFILLAAFKYVTAGGDAEKIKTANKEIAYAAIAIVIGFIARVIPNIALNLVGGGSVTTCT